MLNYTLRSKAVFDKNYKITHFEYIDGEVVQILAKSLNFTPEYMSFGNKKFGYQLPNGTFVGSLAASEYGHADLLGNTFTIIDNNTTNSVFLTPILKIELFFVIRIPETSKSVLLAMMDTIDLKTKLLVLICLVLFPITLFIMQRISSKNPHEKWSFGDSILITASLILNANPKPTPYSSSLRLLLTALMFYSLIQGSIIQSTIIRNLNEDILFGEIKTINQLLENDFKITVSDQLKTLFRNVDGTEMLRKLREISNIPPNPHIDFVYTVPDKKEAIVFRKTLAQNFIIENHDINTKKSCCMIVPENIFKYFATIIAPRNSPYQDRFNGIIQNIVEAGIVNYQLSIANMENDSSMIKKIKNNQIDFHTDKTLRIDAMKSVFLMYISAA